VGADIGTTGCRVCVYGARGDLAVSVNTDYALLTPRPGWVEQSPEEIYAAFRLTVRNAIAKLPHSPHRIRSITLSSVLHSIFPVSRAGEPIHPMLTWADSRAEPYVDQIRLRLDAAALYARTGCPLHPMYPLAKLLWFRHDRPEIFAAAHRFISIKEFVVHRLTGRAAVDRSLASGTGFFDLRQRRWDVEALDSVGVGVDRLSPVYSTTHLITDWSAEALGLPKDTPLVLGAGDGPLSTLGAGGVGSHQFTATIGTSGAVRRCVPTPLTDATARNWCYNLTDDVWVVGGAINNGGLALRWFRDTFAPDDSYETLVREAATVDAGSGGLIFLPFLTGDRAPYWNSRSRGVFFGLTLNHTRAHLARATLEGVLYAMYSVFAALRRLGAGDDDSGVEILASGSFTRSSAWVQMMADVFGHPIIVPGSADASAFGAAALGMVATGDLESIGAIGRIMTAPLAVLQPDRARHATYQELFGLYERLYRNLVDPFDAIAGIQQRLGEA
jgi:gluconokinase